MDLQTAKTERKPSGAARGILEPDRLRGNLESLKMKNTLEILDNYLERAVAENLNIVDALDHIFAEEAKSKRKRADEQQIQMSGFSIKKTLGDFDFSFQLLARRYENQTFSTGPPHSQKGLFLVVIRLVYSFLPQIQDVPVRHMEDRDIRTKALYCCNGRRAPPNSPARPCKCE